MRQCLQHGQRCKWLAPAARSQPRMRDGPTAQSTMSMILRWSLTTRWCRSSTQSVRTAAQSRCRSLIWRQLRKGQRRRRKRP